MTFPTALAPASFSPAGLGYRGSKDMEDIVAGKTAARRPRKPRLACRGAPPPPSASLKGALCACCFGLWVEGFGGWGGVCWAGFWVGVLVVGVLGWGVLGILLGLALPKKEAQLEPFCVSSFWPRTVW